MSETSEKNWGRNITKYSDVELKERLTLRRQIWDCVEIVDTAPPDTLADLRETLNALLAEAQIVETFMVNTIVDAESALSAIESRLNGNSNGIEVVAHGELKIKIEELVRAIDFNSENTDELRDQLLQLVDLMVEFSYVGKERNLLSRLNETKKRLEERIHVLEETGKTNRRVMTIIPSASRRPQVELSPNEKILEAAATAATLIACGGKESAEDKIRELIQKNLRDMDPRVIQTLEGLKNSTSLDSAKLWLERLKALLVV